MVKFILLLLATLVLFLFSMGAFVAEGTVKGPAVGGRLAVRARGRTVTLQAVAFRPNRCYYVVNVR